MPKNRGAKASSAPSLGKIGSGWRTKTVSTTTPRQTKAAKATALSVPEKDDVELDLEKAVFGDVGGFERGLDELDFESGEDDEEEDETAESEDEPVDFVVDEEGEDELAAFENIADEELFVVDGAGDMGTSPITHSAAVVIPSSIKHDGLVTAWDDSDDERLSISLATTDRLRKLRSTETDDVVDGREYVSRLRAQFQRLYPEPEWASVKTLSLRTSKEDVDELSSSEDEAEDDKERALTANPMGVLLQSAASYTSKTKAMLLQPTLLDISRLRDANQQAPSQSAIQTLAFHSSLSLLLSAGYDRTIRIYNIDGKTNALATSLHIKSSPFQTAAFHPDGKRVFAGGRRRNFYIWDLESGGVDKISRMYGHEGHQRSMERFKLSPCGRFIGLIGSGGWVNVLDANSAQWIGGAKIEGGGGVADFVWSTDGSRITIANSAGEIREWSIAERRFVSRWSDIAGGVGVTSLAAAPDDKYIALGSQSGVVNVYDMTSRGEDAQPALLSSLEQLVTPISSLEFSHDGQLLGMASRAKKDAFRFAHVASGTVFKNWPTSGTPLGRVTAQAFSCGSEMFVTGNEAGKVRLFKLNYYS
ncbi:WD40-repeat-containing domain protein [Limtongia smithiae]|uniref:WD40-repeat-containing domain protein n=1 Tax=Limtongia smithiae TaxID=1125753 RepID=UPI0034CF48A6